MSHGGMCDAVDGFSRGIQRILPPLIGGTQLLVPASDRLGGQRDHRSGGTRFCLPNRIARHGAVLCFPGMRKLAAT
jgi:hypothetical protein